jgi:hypothetical protein
MSHEVCERQIYTELSHDLPQAKRRNSHDVLSQIAHGRGLLLADVSFFGRTKCCVVTRDEDKTITQRVVKLTGRSRVSIVSHSE